MPTEQHVIAAAKPKIGVRPQPAAAPEPEKPKRRGKRKVLLVVVLLLVVGGGAGYWFLLKPGSTATAHAAVEPPPEPGEVLVIDPISLNLAEGHYLRLGMGLQLTKDVAKAPDTARALDQALALFSGRTVAEVGSSTGREALRAALVAKLAKVYEGEVMDVYFTDYVTQ